MISWNDWLKDYADLPVYGCNMESFMTALARSSLSSVIDSDTLYAYGKNDPGSVKKHVMMMLTMTIVVMQIIVIGKPN